MNHYSAVSIIFNPKSTGSSKANAEALRRKLLPHMGDIPIQLIPTSHAGHAETLAYELSLATPKPLIISASGDGGYNEVVNGVMKAQSEGATVVTGLLPSGNANDHYHSVTSGDLVKQIVAGRERRIDLLQITATKGAETWQRYAHSYGGIGLSAEASIRLNKIDLTPVKEWMIVLQTFYNTPPRKVVVEDTTHAYHSLIFSNVSRIGKLFTLSNTSKIDDGKFEVIALQSTNKAIMIQHVAKALTRHLEGVKQVSAFTFQNVEKQAMQLDGEIHTLEARTTVEIHDVPRVLRCLI